MNVYQIEYKNIIIDISVNKTEIRFNFKYEDKNYGNAIILENKKTETIVSKTALMILNAVETYEALTTKK